MKSPYIHFRGTANKFKTATAITAWHLFEIVLFCTAYNVPMLSAEASAYDRIIRWNVANQEERNCL